MFRRSSSNGYVKLENNPDGVDLYEDRAPLSADSALLFSDNIRAFSPSAAPKAQMEIITRIWLSLDSLVEEPNFRTIVKQYHLDFISAAEALRDYIAQTPMQGRVLFRYLMCANMCYLMALKFDGALINELLNEKPSDASTLHFLLTTNHALRHRDSRRKTAEDTGTENELRRHPHIAAVHMLSYVAFLQSIASYIAEMRTRLLHIQSSLPTLIQAKKLAFFSSQTEAWQSELDAALRGINGNSPNHEIVTAYEISLNSLLDSTSKKHVQAFATFRSLLDDLTLTRTRPTLSSSRPSV